MSFESYFLIGLGILLAIVGRRVTKLKIGNFQGNLSTGDVSGEVRQTYTSTAPAPRGEKTPIGLREVIGWLIAVLGVAVSAWGVYLGQFSD